MTDSAPTDLDRETLSADPSSEARAEERPVLDRIFARVDVEAPAQPVDVSDFDDAFANAEKPKGELVAAALRVFIDAISKRDREVERIDRPLLDSLVAEIDAKLSEQLDAVLHHPAFQGLEAAWRALKFLVDRTDFRKNVQVELFNASKRDLRLSFEDAPDVIQSPLYKQVYTNAYDQPGADPYSAIVSNYEFRNTAPDIALLQSVSKVAASAHCPFIGSVGPAFFGQSSMEAWRRIPDLEAYMETADFVQWNAFRASEDARYVGLAFPRFMARLPYGEDTVPVRDFCYREDVRGSDARRYLWANPSFAFATNVVRAFIRDGWAVQIRGPRSGGKIEHLPVHRYDAGRGTEAKIPTEIPISETLEFAASNLGFMPLSVYQGRDYACFFSAHSAQRPRIYDQAEATANSRVNARLPYVLLASRIAHYLKVLQRENVGATKDAAAIERELNAWVGDLVTKMPKPSDDLVSKYPLRDAAVRVRDVERNPGLYRIEMTVMPHFQIEGMDISLSMVSQISRAAA
jgi:type VI secretion system protein ImpC